MFVKARCTPFTSLPREVYPSCAGELSRRVVGDPLHGEPSAFYVAYDDQNGG